MQECPDAIPEGETPHSVTLYAHDCLVDMAKPGDRITLTGIYKLEGMRVSAYKSILKSVYKTHIDAIHISQDKGSKTVTAKLGESLDEGIAPGSSQQATEEPGFQVLFLCLTKQHCIP